MSKYYIDGQNVSKVEFDDYFKRLDQFFNKAKFIKRMLLGMGISMVLFSFFRLIGILILVCTLFWMFRDYKEYGETFW